MQNIFQIFLTLAILIHTAAFSQSTLEGMVKESGSGEPIVFAHIFFKSTQIGTTSDTEGQFRLQLPADRKADTLIVSCLGYHTEKILIGPNTSAKLQIELRPQFTQMQELVVLAGENPAWAVLEKIVKQKEKNNPENRQSYTCEEYSKIRFDLNHFTEKIKQNVMLRPFDFIWDDVDTTSDGVTYLPVLLVEKKIDHYYQRSPKRVRDVVGGINATGLKGPKIMNFVEDLYLTPNLYDNFVVILDKSFPSPINDNFRSHYNHYLDSVMVDGVDYYQITFQPKFKRDLAFTGEMLVDKLSLAIKQVELRFDIMANVNFVRSYWVSQKYEKVNGIDWMPVESQVIGDFTVVENSAELTGFFGRKNSTYKNYQLDVAIPPSVFKGSEIVVQDDDALERHPEYWEANRHTPLTEKENGVFEMVKKLEKDPAFILRKNLIMAVLTGYVPVKSIDIGNFYSFYSYNIVEYSRLKFGFRTGKKLDIPLRLSTYGAYGMRDEKWKYNISADWTFGKEKKKQKRIGASYKYDIEQLGRSFHQIEIDNVLTSFIQYGEVASRNYVEDFTGYIENNWTTGLLTRLSYFNNTISPTRDNIFFTTNEGINTPVSSFNATGVGLTFKFIYQKSDIDGRFYSDDDSKPMFRKYPDLALEWRRADKRLFNSGLDFTKLNIMLKQNFRLQKLGYVQYYIEAGKTWGTVPYPYLNIPFGNQLVLQDDYAFNLMNFLEYASDEFVSATVQHHFGGLILDHIPLINKLKWRNFIFARAYWGRLSEQNNQEQYLFPANLRALNKGYYEAGFGIENIFKIARIDFTWRLTDTDAPGVYAFIVKPSFRLSF